MIWVLASGNPKIYAKQNKLIIIYWEWKAVLKNKTGRKHLPERKDKGEKKGAIFILGPEWLSGLGLPMKGHENNLRNISKGNR